METIITDTDIDDVVIANPAVCFFLWDDGEAQFDFTPATGGQVNFSFTNSEEMRNIAAAFTLAADERDAIINGDFESVKTRHGGVETDETFTVEDILNG